MRIAALFSRGFRAAYWTLTALMFSATGPASGQWTSQASLPAARSQAAVVADSTGRVHAFGGFTSTSFSDVSNSHYIYDPATNSWTTGAVVPYQTRGPAANLGPDGRIYVAGGYVNDALQTA